MKHFQSQLTHAIILKDHVGGPQQENVALKIIIIIETVKLRTF